MDEFWKYIWKSFPISPWSVALYAVWIWWAHKKLPSTSYKRIAWLGKLADTLCILGILALIGDTLWVSLCWFRWPESYSGIAFPYIFLPIVRNTSMIVVCTLLVSRNWLREGYIQINREVAKLIGINILYMVLRFYLAPGKEWTNWLYAIQNDFACWPYVWFLDYIVCRGLTTLVWLKMWSPKNAS